MNLTRTSLLKYIKILAAVIVVAVIVSYAIWRSLNYARGPHIDIFEPVNGSAIQFASTTIKGKALRINNLTLNDHPILIDEEGNFNEVVIVFPGINRITVTGHDQFGRSTKTLLEIVGKGELPEPKNNTRPATIATSTATSSANVASTTTQIGQ